MIGLSLSFCVSDIIAGKVNVFDVEKIICGTKARNPVDWDDVIEQYRETYWDKNPDEGERIARFFISTGKVEQPRLEGKNPPIMHRNWWAASEADVRYPNPDGN